MPSQGSTLMTSSKPKYLLKAHMQIPSHWGSSLWVLNTNPQSMAAGVNIRHALSCAQRPEFFYHSHWWRWLQGWRWSLPLPQLRESMQTGLQCCPASTTNEPLSSFCGKSYVTLRHVSCLKGRWNAAYNFCFNIANEEYSLSTFFLT